MSVERKPIEIDKVHEHFYKKWTAGSNEQQMFNWTADVQMNSRCSSDQHLMNITFFHEQDRPLTPWMMVTI